MTLENNIGGDTNFYKQHDKFFEEPKTADWLLVKATLKSKGVNTEENPGLVTFYKYYIEEDLERHRQEKEKSQMRIDLFNELQKINENANIDLELVKKLYKAEIISKNDFDLYTSHLDTSKRLEKNNNPFSVLKEIVNPETEQIKNKIKNQIKIFLEHGVDMDISVIENFNRKNDHLKSIDLGSMQQEEYIALLQKSHDQIQARVAERKFY